MYLGIHQCPAILSFLYILLIFDNFGLNGTRSVMHNLVHKAEPQSGSDQTSDHAPFGETVTRLNDEKYWLYATVDLKPIQYLIQSLNQPKISEF